jgi:hypothetical protein
MYDAFSFQLTTVRRRNFENKKPFSSDLMSEERPTKRRRLDFEAEAPFLPDEMVVEIASRVSCAAAIEAMALTCVDWHRAICADKVVKQALWKTLTVRDFPGAATYMGGLRRLAERMSKFAQPMWRQKGKLKFFREENSRVRVVLESYRLPDEAIYADEHCFNVLFSIDPQATMEAYTYFDDTHTCASGYRLKWSRIEYPRVCLSFYSSWQEPSSDEDEDEDESSD